MTSRLCIVNIPSFRILAVLAVLTPPPPLAVSITNDCTLVVVCELALPASSNGRSRGHHLCSSLSAT